MKKENVVVLSTLIFILIISINPAAGPAPLFYFEEKDAEHGVNISLESMEIDKPSMNAWKGKAKNALVIQASAKQKEKENSVMTRMILNLKALRDISFLLSQHVHIEPESKPVYMCPGYIYNTNNAEKSEGEFPQLVYRGEVGTPESSKFFFRTDRSSHCSVIAMYDDSVTALCIPEGITLDGEFYYNGLGIDASSGPEDALAVTLGYKNLPARYNGNCAPRISPRWNEEPNYGWVNMKKGQALEVEYLIYRGEGGAPFGYEKPLRVFYDFLREETREYENPKLIARLISDAIVQDAVVKESGLFRVIDQSDECDIGWTGGMMVAGPLLEYGIRSGDVRAKNTAINAMESLVKNGFNPDASMFYDAWRNGEWTVDGWWRGWAGGNHLAYTNGQSVYYILDAFQKFSPVRKKRHELMLDRCLLVLNNAVKHQYETGEFPASYSPEDGSPGDIKGFGGCWFFPASVKAFELTGDTRYLKAAFRAEAFYYEWLKTLEVWGTPIDAEGAVELEGNLPLVKGERLLYELTACPLFRDHLERAVNYDLSWKWAYNTYFENPPLKEMNWLSQGGNSASNCNIHLHPMSNMILDDLWFLYEETEDEYYRERYEDSFRFGLGCINRRDKEFGFGKAGWGTEQFFHTDALQGQKPRDGGIWTRYLCWATASVLHSLVTAPEEYIPEW
mgnify:CR=1 FL=1